MAFKIQVVMGFLLLMSLLAASAVCAAGANTDAQFRWAADERMDVMEGEILHISDHRLRMVIAGQTREFLIGDRPTVHMNGRPARLQALRPVADDCYFLGRIWIDVTGIVRRIDGDYRGASVWIISAVPMTQGGLRLTVACTEEPGEPRRRYETTSTCRGIEKVPSGIAMVEAFLLFDLTGKVRGVYF